MCALDFLAIGQCLLLTIPYEASFTAANFGQYTLPNMNIFCRGPCINIMTDSTPFTWLNEVSRSTIFQ